MREREANRTDMVGDAGIARGDVTPVLRAPTSSGQVDPDFDRLVRLAAAATDAPAAILAMIDARGRWSVQAQFGIDAAQAAAALSGKGLAALAVRADVNIAVHGQTLGTLSVLYPSEAPAPAPERIARLEDVAALAATVLALRDRSQAGARAEAALVHAETRRALALEAAALASWVWNPRSGVIECDAFLPQLFNLPPATRVRARDIAAAIDRRDIGRTRRLFQEALHGSDDYSGEYRVRGSEPPRWLAARGRVVERDAAGRPTLVFGVNYDITERRTAEESQRFLLRELNHRVKNTLATVQALASQTVRHASDPHQFLDAFSQRLRALGVAHGLLSEHEWRGIGIRELARQELTPFDETDAPRISITGPDVRLTPDQALGLALVLHELASNALKYGALSVPQGKVSLSWSIRSGKGEKRLVLKWAESGGPKVSPPEHHGFGSILIRRSLAKVISSEVRHEYLPAGVRAEISMPLEGAPDHNP
ncbi:sensor histidine kinase [Mesorhizobium sp. ANAO-SY3R2]|uniref:sensor histidine kinase n=1 Tax=Mesorhizobium sp. ANAO-SY3R2 TaxID=3166644 RepID=UPI00366B3678